jgi:hypothetical protein
MPLLNGSDYAILHVRLLGFCTPDNPLVYILFVCYLKILSTEKIK